jgi:hypothetical protein
MLRSRYDDAYLFFIALKQTEKWPTKLTGSILNS